MTVMNGGLDESTPSMTGETGERNASHPRSSAWVLMLTAGMGLMTDNYDLTIINLVRPLLLDIYPVQDFHTSWQVREANEEKNNMIMFQ